MWRSKTNALLLGAIFVIGVAPAYAQRWGREATPRSGVCFYEDINFGGRYFCSAIGASTPRLSSTDNDRISSIRVVGDAVATVYQNPNFSGPSRVIDSNWNDLRSARFNDRISSFRVDSGRYGVNSPRGPYYGGNVRRPSDVPYGTAGRANESRWTYREAERIVRQSYRSVLGRDPDPSGLQNWTQEVVNNNWTQPDLERALRQSDEYRQLNHARRR